MKNPFKMDKDLDFDQIAQDKEHERELQRKKLMKTSSFQGSSYLYHN